MGVILLDTLPTWYYKKIIIDLFNYAKLQNSTISNYSNKKYIFIFSILEDESDDLPMEEVYEDEMMKK